jgi:general stress protein 26
LLIFSFSSVNAQIEGLQLKEQPSDDSLLTIARAIIDSAESRTLISVDAKGKPRARTMSPFPPEKNWIIWLGTSTKSRKVKEIKNNPNVIVFYYDSDSWSYVSVGGKATLVNNPDKKAQYWKEGWKRFYPDRDKDYILIKVIPERLEVCSFKHRLFWDPETKMPAFVLFDSVE